MMWCGLRSILQCLAVSVIVVWRYGTWILTCEHNYNTIIPVLYYSLYTLPQAGPSDPSVSLLQPHLPLLLQQLSGQPPSLTTHPHVIYVPRPLTQALLVGVASGEVGVYQLKNVSQTADKVSWLVMSSCSWTDHTPSQELLLSIVKDAVHELFKK